LVVGGGGELLVPAGGGEFSAGRGEGLNCGNYRDGAPIGSFCLALVFRSGFRGRSVRAGRGSLILAGRERPSRASAHGRAVGVRSRVLAMSGWSSLGG
jgi:hypothetical protein